MNTPTIPDGYMADSKGRLVPEDQIRPQDLLQDQAVRKILDHAEELNGQIARFKGHTFDDVATFVDLLREKYGVAKGGQKGNVTLTSFDGCLKVQVAVQDFLTFGPELQVAKELFDACIGEWSADANPKIRTLVDHAFQVDKEGRINRAALFGLRRLEIDDADWKAAIEALDDSIRVQGSREYVRFYKRPNPRAPWRPVTIDLASAIAPAERPQEDAA